MLIVELVAEEKMEKRRNDSLVTDTTNSQRFFASNMELLKAFYKLKHYHIKQLKSENRNINSTPNSRCPIFNRIFYGTRISAATGSVILYIVTLFIVRRYSKRIKEQQNSGSVKINKRQLNFTKTVGLSCFATAGLYVLPMIIAFYETSKDKVPNITFVIVIVITILNSFSKTIIVGYRSHDIRDAVIDIMPGVFRK
ncbi:putative integral membrane protein [Brugia pahangi]